MIIYKQGLLFCYLCHKRLAPLTLLKRYAHSKVDSDAPNYGVIFWQCTNKLCAKMTTFRHQSKRGLANDVPCVAASGIIHEST